MYYPTTQESRYFQTTERNQSVKTFRHPDVIADLMSYFVSFHIGNLRLPRSVRFILIIESYIVARYNKALNIHYQSSIINYQLPSLSNPDARRQTREIKLDKTQLTQFSIAPLPLSRTASVSNFGNGNSISNSLSYVSSARALIERQ